MEFLESFGQISSTSHYPNQKLVHMQGEEIHQNAASKSLKQSWGELEVSYWRQTLKNQEANWFMKYQTSRIM